MKKSIILIILLLFGIMIFSLLSRTLHISFLSFTFSSIKGMQHFFYDTGLVLKEWIETQDVSLIKDENNHLKKELLQTHLTLARLELLERENETLKKQLSFFEGSLFPHHLAAVLGAAENGSASKTLLLDAGAKDGVQIGQAVIVENGVLIGKIMHVKERISTVRLLNDTESKVAVTLLNRNNTLGIIEGELGLSLAMNMIPKTEMIQREDLVITSGLERNVPRGLFIGTIDEVRPSETELFQRATIDALVDYQKQSIVAIILAQE